MKTYMKWTVMVLFVVAAVAVAVPAQAFCIERPDSCIDWLDQCKRECWIFLFAWPGTYSTCLSTCDATELTLCHDCYSRYSSECTCESIEPWEDCEMNPLICGPETQGADPFGGDADFLRDIGVIRRGSCSTTAAG